MLYNLENPHGGDVYSSRIEYDFSSNINPFGIPEGVKEAVRKSIDEMHHYPDPYCQKLVGSIAEYENVPESAILCGNGAAELIYSYCEAAAPKSALVTAPTFSEYALGLQRAGCIPKRFLLDPKNHFDPDEAFPEKIRELKPDVVFVCSPNNPTGRLVKSDLLDQILHTCEKEGIRLFVDETFLDLAEGESMKKYLPEYEGLFLLKAFTKNFGIAGLRLGYALTSDTKLLERMSAAVQPWNVSVPAQAAGIAAMNDPGFVKAAASFIKNERPALKAQLEELGFDVCPSDANYLLFYTNQNICDPLRQRGIAIRDCANYEGLCRGWYRIAVRTHEENTVLINALKEVLYG